MIGKKPAPSPGDLVTGTTTAWCRAGESFDFIGRLVAIGGDAFTEVMLDNGRTCYVYSHEPLTVLERFAGPSSAVRRMPTGEWRLTASALRAA